MNNLRNHVQLIGRLGQDPEIRTFENNRMKASFSLATSDSYKNAKGEKVIETQWHNIIAWGKNAELMEKLLKKGNEVVLQGKLVHRSWQGEDGHKRYTTEIIVNEFVLVGAKIAA